MLDEVYILILLGKYFNMRSRKLEGEDLVIIGHMPI